MDGRTEAEDGPRCKEVKSVFVRCQMATFGFWFGRGENNGSLTDTDTAYSGAAKAAKALKAIVGSMTMTVAHVKASRFRQ